MAAGAAMHCPMLPGPLGVPRQCQPHHHHYPCLPGAGSKGLPSALGGTISPLCPLLQASGLPSMPWAGTAGFTGGGWYSTLAQPPLLCMPCIWNGNHAVVGVPFSLLQAHLPVLHLAHMPAGHRGLLRHDVPHQPRVGLGEPGLPPRPPPRPPLPLAQQHLGVHQPGPHLPPGEPCPPPLSPHGVESWCPQAGVPVAAPSWAVCPWGWHPHGVVR